MSKPDKEIAAEILIAALTSKSVATPGAIPDAQAETIMRVYGVILDGLRDPPANRLPKQPAK